MPAAASSSHASLGYRTPCTRARSPKAAAGSSKNSRNSIVRSPSPQFPILTRSPRFLPPANGAKMRIPASSCSPQPSCAQPRGKWVSRMHGHKIDYAPAGPRLKNTDLVSPGLQFRDNTPEEMRVAVIPIGTQRMVKQDDLHAAPMLGLGNREMI